MIVLKILGIILAVIVLLILVILFLPIDIVLRYNGDKGFQLLYRFLGKLYGENPDPNNPIAKALKNLVGISHLESKEHLRTAVEDSGFAGTLTGTLSSLKLLIDRVLWLLPRSKLKKMKVVSISAGEDAADTALAYGAACAALYPLISYLESVMRVRKNGVHTHISCDFEAEKAVFELDMAFSFHILHGLRALWHIAKEQAAEQFEHSEVTHGTQRKQENE